MKRLISTWLILTFLIGLMWMVSTQSIGALPSLIQLTNTPAPPADAPSVLLQFSDPIVGEGAVEQAFPVSPIAEQFVRDDAHARQALQHAQILRQMGRRFQVIGLGDDTNTQSTPPSGSVCRTVLLNPRMDVTEFGDGTGSIEHWAVIAQQIYYDNRSGYYRSPSHALVMGDDPADDTQIISPTLDWDAFGQGFQAPPAMTAITVTYSRLYTNTNAGDTAWGNLWTLDSQGYLDELILYWHIGENPSGWGDHTVVITDTYALAALSGRPLALVFDVEANRASPNEFIWLDDAQMTICYRPPAHATYLPLVMRQYGVVTGPACVPYEPDSVNQRGSTAVGATCYGSFSATDIKDYYSLNLRGVAQVRLSLTNLPSGTNWDAMIYEDAPGYPLACQIGIPGSGDKSKDCDLNLNKSYFVLVSAGTAPTGGANTYQMSVTSRTAATPTPPPSGWITILSENFEGAFPGPWQVSDQRSGYGEYYWGKRNCKAYSGSYSGWAVGGGANGGALSCGASYPNYALSWMVYGPFSLADATAAELRLRTWAYTEQNYDWLCWTASGDGSNFNGPCISGDSRTWTERVLNLASIPDIGNLLGDSSVWIALIFFSDSSIAYPEGAYVDDIVLRKCTASACPASTGYEPVVESSQFVERPFTFTIERMP